jgi:hypothetical protein
VEHASSLVAYLIQRRRSAIRARSTRAAPALHRGRIWQPPCNPRLLPPHRPSAAQPSWRHPKRSRWSSAQPPKPVVRALDGSFQMASALHAPPVAAPLSRFALYRQRKQANGADVRSRLTAAQLDALEAQPAALRTPADNQHCATDARTESAGASKRWGRRSREQRAAPPPVQQRASLSLLSCAFRRARPLRRRGRRRCMAARTLPVILCQPWSVNQHSRTAARRPSSARFDHKRSTLVCGSCML